MRPIRRLPAAAAALGLLFAPLGCDDDPADPGLDGAARVDVILTDAPGDVAAAWVRIEEIYLQGEGGRVDLLTEPTDLIELTALVGTAVVLVEDAELEPGRYGQLRFVVGDAVLEAEDGTVYVLDEAEHPGGLEATGRLQCPSCQQSGIKVVLPGDELDLDAGESTVVLDFDVSQTFGHRAGNSGMWVMRPTIHGTWVDGGGPVLGPTVGGTVAVATGVEIPACPAGTARSVEDFVPVATATTLVDGQGEILVRSGETSADGTFVLGPLAADLWTLGHLGTLELDGAELTFEATVTPADVTMDGTAVTGVSYVVTAATCSASGG